MKLSEALDFGIDCGMDCVGDAILNVDLHAQNIFPYAKINDELNEMYSGYHELVKLGGDMEMSIVDAIELMNS